MKKLANAGFYSDKIIILKRNKHVNKNLWKRCFWGECRNYNY